MQRIPRSVGVLALLGVGLSSISTSGQEKLWKIAHRASGFSTGDWFR